MDNQQGPAGPTAFWKISDEIDEAKVDEWIDGWGSDSDEENDPDFDEGPEEETEGAEGEAAGEEGIEEEHEDRSDSVEAVNGDGALGEEGMVITIHGGMGILFAANL